MHKHLAKYSPNWRDNFVSNEISSISRHILASLARLSNGGINTFKDIMSLEMDGLLKYIFRRTFPRKFCPSKLTTITWTLTWTKCPNFIKPQFIQAEDFKSILYRPNTPQVTPQDTMQVTMQVELLLKVLDGALSRDELQEKIGINNRDYFRKAYINGALNQKLIEMTIPEKPKSKNQKYRLTPNYPYVRTRLNRLND